jgi:hypothetical protein
VGSANEILFFENFFVRVRPPCLSVKLGFFLGEPIGGAGEEMEEGEPAVHVLVVDFTLSVGEKTAGAVSGIERSVIDLDELSPGSRFLSSESFTIVCNRFSQVAVQTHRSICCVGRKI